VATSLPESARFALWYSAWVAGRASLDDARDAMVAGDAAHDVAGLPGDPGLQPLIIALGRLRGMGATGAGIALPVPGDPLGLAGPPAFTEQSLEHGQAVLLDGADWGLVPHRAGAGVVWRCEPAVSRRQVPDPSEADTALRAAIARAASDLAALDVGRWNPDAADGLMELRRPGDYHFPPGTTPRAVRLASLASRCRVVVELARGDDGGAVTAAEADRRRDALVPLDSAARRALVAACSFSSQR
jgi:hypothetical protein